jgi:hypothetical protein
MSKIEHYHNEFRHRIDLIEYHALCIHERTHDIKSLFHSEMLLKILNPSNNYNDPAFCLEQRQKLERQYYDDFGRLKEV